jgi:hypothetical protein
MSVGLGRANVRGLIKIQYAGGGNNLMYWMADMNEFFAELSPLVTGMFNWASDTRIGWDAREWMSDWQRSATYINSGYLVYADELEVEFHQAGTDAYNGMVTESETTGDPTQGNSKTKANTALKTNQDPYRIIKFKTTLSQRDPDLPIGPIDAFRRGDWLEIPKQTVQWGIDSLIGIARMKAYFQKRAEFLRDFDNREVVVSSTMFYPVQGYINASKMTIQAGQSEASYDVEVKELSELIVPDEKGVTGKTFQVEPGVGFF